jgi:hypothetical protein
VIPCSMKEPDLPTVGQLLLTARALLIFFAI